MSECKKVLVTGGAGYIGARLIPKLLAEGYAVRVLDAQFFSGGLDRLAGQPQLESVRGDIRDKAAVEHALRGIHTVVHLAAVANDPSFDADPRLSRSINIDCLPYLMRTAKRSGCRRFIYASSASVYGVNAAPIVDESQPCVPVTDYNRYKAQGEAVLFDLADESFETIAVRAATVCGMSCRQRLDLTVNVLTASALANGRITVFGGHQYRPNVHIADLCRLYALLVKSDSLGSLQGRAINVGDENHTVADIALQVKRIVDLYFGTDVPVQAVASDDIRSYRLDSTLIHREFGFEFAYSIRDAVLELCEQWQEGRFKDSSNVLADPRYHNLLNMRSADWSFALPSERAC